MRVSDSALPTYSCVQISGMSAEVAHVFRMVHREGRYLLLGSEDLAPFVLSCKESHDRGCLVNKKKLLVRKQDKLKGGREEMRMKKEGGERAVTDEITQLVPAA